MDNKKLVAIWEEIERIAKNDLEYIKTLPDVDGIAKNYMDACVAILNRKGRKYE